MSIFKENLTSKIIRENTLELINKSKRQMKILEIGCGNGNITKYLVRNCKTKHNYFLSDISLESVTFAKKNINRENCTFKTGIFLNPWKNKKFDLIISDISSINDDIAKKSGWYDGVVCNSGKDGLKNIKIILKRIKSNLYSSGVFVLPVISLCNEINLIKKLKNKFNNVKKTEKVEWPLPSFFKNDLRKYIIQKRLKNINFYMRYGSNIAYTYLAVCRGIK